MKAKKNFKKSNFEKNDENAQKGKSSKKDRSSKRRLSIYDDFDEDSMDFDYDLRNDEEDEEE